MIEVGQDAWVARRIEFWDRQKKAHTWGYEPWACRVVSVGRLAVCLQDRHELLVFFPPTDVFATRAEAAARCAVLAQEEAADGA
jgi:hypothetical protein